MTFWQIIADVVTPGAPRHAALQASLARHEQRVQQLGGQRSAGQVLHPLDEIALCAYEVAKWN